MAFDGFWGIVTNNTIGLGWLRYFTFTNMILPSDSFWIYNDLYGFWTMGCFPIFYLLVPLLYKWLDRKNGVFELLYSGIILNILVKGLVTKLLPSFGVDEIGSFSNLNPLSTLYLFIFGMCVANGKLKNAEKKAMSALATAFMVMLVFEKNGYVLWGLASAFICLTSDYFKVPSQFIESIWYRVLMFLDNISFYVYLTHLLVANIVKSLINLHGGIGAAISLATSVAVSAALNKVFSTILLFKRTPKTL
jgi:peptidoglycan/LPS O-acetylase OafA/YrhL